jgi:hypothetical protein
MSSEVKANKLSPSSGTALQISDSGDTTTIPSGATLAIASGATVTNSGTATGFGLFSSYAIIADQKAQGTEGGTATSGAWRTRDLQTEIADPDSIVSISSDQFTLGAGSYLITWSAPAMSCDRHQTRLYDVTGTAEVEAGTSEYAWPSGNVSTRSCGAARISPGSSNVYQIEHQVQTTMATNGWGLAQNFTTEQYTIVEIFKEA